LPIVAVTSSFFSAIGCVVILATHNSVIAFYGAVVSAVSILALFFGQRMAKDYAGAAVLVPYFLLCLVAIYLLA
jgi:diacylglycerol kinase